MEDNHLELAILGVNQARDKSHRTVDVSIEALASIATAHAVLALIDYLQQDDEDELPTEDQAHAYLTLYNDWEIAMRRVRVLEKDLEGTRATLRNLEHAIADEMKQNKET